MKLILITALLALSGCTATDKDLKATNCAAKFEFICDCTKDSSIITDMSNSTSEVIRGD